MDLSRREFAGFAVMALAVPSIPGAAWARQGVPGSVTTVLDWTPIGEGVYAAVGGGGNSVLVRSGRKAALIDTKLCGYGAVLGREIGMLGSSVELVINTHHHGDHTGGNSIFTEHTRVVAHEKAKPRVLGQRERYRGAAASTLRDLAKSGAGTAALVIEQVEEMVEGWGEIETSAFAPTETVGGDASFTIGDRELLVRHVGAGHTDNDLFVYLPGANILHTGDLLFHKTNPYIDTSAGVDINGWLKSCETMLKVCDEKTVVVPGHGEVTDRAGIQEQIDYFGLIRRTVERARGEGKSKEEVQAIEPSEVAGFGFPQLLKMNLGLVYDGKV
jgi:glyoxylase-like metal-dependent hydrolase (beta-lactamase superfamily II)